MTKLIALHCHYLSLLHILSLSLVVVLVVILFLSVLLFILFHFSRIYPPLLKGLLFKYLTVRYNVTVSAFVVLFLAAAGWGFE